MTHLRRRWSVAAAARCSRGRPAARLRIRRRRPCDRLVAGTVDDQVARYRELGAAGVQTAIVALPDVATPGALEAFGEVIAAFQSPG